MITVRPGRLDDLDALYRICLQTGDAGEDATALHEDPQLLGHIFVGPYAVLEPSLAFVAEDAEGVSGFILGALDTRAFEAEMERDWWPELREQYPDPISPVSEDEKLMRTIHHPFRTPEKYLDSYPSHLHINLLPRTQGQGVGGRLMQTLFDALRAKGSPGVHLSVWSQNHRAIGFYRHLGFTEIDNTGDGCTYAMDLRA
ncbi:GNAT family N-acetyltransferase [Kibdelosporangium philippinense]|uniref:GNAT family N-acetyltransferase n=1 Tax=Kibdelosporangium philippinense TaxID=211113 RepID=A0ABS8Z6T3_9PSEU|nr:GNAT family N-acetyltransferase [Kibdelosporangium philippinense]MCE7002769.1 GNAT family N-acetyltransferase [Kibdelosporangium philippinense]